MPAVKKREGVWSGVPPRSRSGRGLDVDCLNDENLRHQADFLPLPGLRVRSVESVSRSDDTNLADRVRAGDERAFETLFGLYYDPLCRFAQVYVRSHSDAEDLVQSLFVQLWEQRRTWALRGSVRAYLYTAVRNSALNVLKHRVVERRVFDDASDVREIPRRSPTPHDDAAAHELEEAIDRAIAALPERYRLVISLRAQHHLAIPEIARILDLPVKTAETRAARAVVALRAALQRFLG